MHRLAAQSLDQQIVDPQETAARFQADLHSAFRAPLADKLGETRAARIDPPVRDLIAPSIQHAVLNETIVNVQPDAPTLESLAPAL
ncbi:MAG: hypothetical protein AMXMBFR7_45430 [Planctomycetota bacterium]